MEKLKSHLMELWDDLLCLYRTMVIKAELKRRKSISHAQGRNNGNRKVHLRHDDNQGESERDSHSMSIPDASSSTPAPSGVNNCDRSEMKRVFDLFDENKDGLISAKDLQLYMKRLGVELSDQKVRDMVKTVDRNSDDYVDFEEFFSLYNPLCQGEGESSVHHSQISKEDDDVEEALLRAFFVFDENKDGLITGLELQQVLLKLGLPEGKSLMCCQKMISRVDADGDGKVDFFEFKEMMSSKAFSFGKS